MKFISTEIATLVVYVCIGMMFAIVAQNTSYEGREVMSHDVTSFLLTVAFWPILFVIMMIWTAVK